MSEGEEVIMKIHDKYPEKTDGQSTCSAPESGKKRADVRETEEHRHNLNRVRLLADKYQMSLRKLAE